jgi:integrase
MLFIDYLPAELKSYKKEWFVSYYVKNPQTGKLHRKKVKVNRIKNINERKKFAKKLVLEINNKLQTGWNPFIEQEAPKAYTKLVDALKTYIKCKTKELPSDESVRTYKSQAKVLMEYIVNIKKEPDLLVISFDNKYVNDFMDYIYTVRDVENKTFNNYKTFCLVAWNWFIEKLYCKANPFESVTKKKVTKKTRTIIDAETRNRIKNYLLSKDKKEFLAMVMLCFHGLIRPIEICQLKPEYFKLDKRIIVLPPEITKDDDDRIVSISNDLLKYLENLNIEKINKSYYIFSEYFKPGTKLINSRDTGREWSNMRKELNFPDKYQFYSLKDTGIVQMLLDGIPAIEVRNQAGHSSLEQTNEYAIYANPTGSEQIKNKATDF